MAMAELRKKRRARQQEEEEEDAGFIFPLYMNSSVERFTFVWEFYPFLRLFADGKARCCRRQRDGITCTYFALWEKRRKRNTGDTGRENLQLEEQFKE